VILAFLLPYDFKERIGFHMIGGGYDLDWRYSFFFLENYKMLLMDNFPKTTPLSVFWSLCIEEHFYIIWMILFFLLPAKRIFSFLIFSILVGWMARYFDPMIWENTLVQQNDFFTNIDYFAIGGILGYWVAKDFTTLSDKILSIPNSLKYLWILFVIGLVIFQDKILPSENYWMNIFRPTVIATAFTLLITIFIPQKSTIRISHNNILSYLGKISYGLYVYHLIFVHVLFQYCLKENILLDTFGKVGVFSLLVLGGSIMVSILSYRFLELPFLKWRERF
jgi:peptidoglycan/LPS O-acetylase OafA/YrhL